MNTFMSSKLVSVYWRVRPPTNFCSTAKMLVLISGLLGKRIKAPSTVQASREELGSNRGS